MYIKAMVLVVEGLKALCWKSVREVQQSSSKEKPHVPFEGGHNHDSPGTLHKDVAPYANFIGQASLHVLVFVHTVITVILAHLHYRLISRSIRPAPPPISHQPFRNVKASRCQTPDRFCLVLLASRPSSLPGH